MIEKIGIGIDIVDINQFEIISNKISGNNFDVYLKLYLSNATEIPLNYTVFSYPTAKSWNMGTGRLGNVPATEDGASWKYTDQSGSIVWSTGTFPVDTTGSYYVSGTIGGGIWYSNQSYESSQSFTNISSKDILPLPSCLGLDVPLPL